MARWFGLLFLVFLISCQNTETQKIPPQTNHFFNLENDTRLTLPISMKRTNDFNDRDPLTQSIFNSFRKKLGEVLISEAYFQDSLAQKHTFAAYQIKPEAYDQNVATLIFNNLIIYTNALDDSLTCQSLENFDAREYSSNHWKALKIKYQFNPSGSCDLNPNKKTFATFYYFNNTKKAYYFLEYNDGVADLDGVIRDIRL